MRIGFALMTLIITDAQTTSTSTTEAPGGVLDISRIAPYVDSTGNSSDDDNALLATAVTTSIILFGIGIVALILICVFPQDQKEVVYVQDPKEVVVVA